MTRALVALALLASSCGAGALEMHARAAVASETVLSQAQASIRSARSAEVTRAIEAAPDRETAREQRDAIDVRYQSAIDTYEGVRAIHSLWVRAILQAAEGRPFDVAAAMGFAHDLVLMWSELRTLAERVGLALPDLAQMVNAVTTNP